MLLVKLLVKKISRSMPQRTCVACRQVRPKRDLIRLVGLSGGGVEVDLSGKKAGRGAYLCRNAVCWDMGLKGDQLERALKARLSYDEREQLAKFGRRLISGGLVQ